MTSATPIWSCRNCAVSPATSAKARRASATAPVFFSNRSNRSWSTISANTAILTCLANDLDYSQIFSAQLDVYGRVGDLLVVLSGSGNSPNILRAIEQAKARGMKTFAILGYSGGKAKAMVDVPIHFAVDDMQIAEDLQLVAGHMVMQWLYRQRPG